METPEEFAENWMRYVNRGWVNFTKSLCVGFVVGGIGIAIWQFYDEPGQLAVPFLLTGIAVLLFHLVGCAEGIVCDLDYLQKIVNEKRSIDTLYDTPQA